jgi:hypothetical protein
MDRVTILKSPGTISFDGAVIHSENDIEVTLSKDLFEVTTSGFSVVDRRVRDKTITITCTPSMWLNMDKLFPYAALPVGASIYGSTDRPLVITPRTGAPLTIANAAVTTLPNLNLSAQSSAIGQMTFTGIVANEANPSAIASYLAWGSHAANADLTGFDLTKVRNAPYTLTRNSIAYLSETGYQVNPTLNLEPVYVDGLGTVDMRLNSLTMAVQFTPVGKTEASITTDLGFAEAMGEGVAKHDSVITGGGLTVTVRQTLLQQVAYRYGQANRLGQLEALTVRSHTTGVTNALWTFAEA